MLEHQPGELQHRAAWSMVHDNALRLCGGIEADQTTT